MHSSLALQLAWILVGCAAVAAQRPTIPEMAANGEATDIAVHEENVGVELFDLAASADVVMQGIVKRLSSTLSDDKYRIYTLFELENPMIIGSAPARTRPTPEPVQIVFRQLGGTVLIGGVQMSMTSSALPLLPDGSLVVVFLRELHDDVAGQRQYELVNSAAALGIEDGRVIPLSHTLNEAASVRGRSAAEVRALIATHRESLETPK